MICWERPLQFHFRRGERIHDYIYIQYIHRIHYITNSKGLPTNNHLELTVCVEIHVVVVFVVVVIHRRDSFSRRFVPMGVLWNVYLVSGDTHTCIFIGICEKDLAVEDCWRGAVVRCGRQRGKTRCTRFNAMCTPLSSALCPAAVKTSSSSTCLGHLKPRDRYGHLGPLLFFFCSSVKAKINKKKTWWKSFLSHGIVTLWQISMSLCCCVEEKKKQENFFWFCFGSQQQQQQRRFRFSPPKSTSERSKYHPLRINKKKKQAAGIHICFDTSNEILLGLFDLSVMYTIEQPSTFGDNVCWRPIKIGSNKMQGHPSEITRRTFLNPFCRRAIETKCHFDKSIMANI